jgi:hypothetical protein
MHAEIGRHVPSAPSIEMSSKELRSLKDGTLNERGGSTTASRSNSRQPLRRSATQCSRSVLTGASALELGAAALAGDPSCSVTICLRASAKLTDD